MQERSREVRRQVPLTDPTYRSELARWQQAGRADIFGRDAMKGIQRFNEVRERIRLSNESLHADLANAEDEEQIQRIRRTLQANTEVEQQQREYQREGLREPFQRMTRELYRLMILSQNEERKAYANNEVLDMFSDPAQRSELEEHFGKDLSEFNSLNLAIKISDGSVSDEALLIAAQRHEKRMAEYEQTLERFAEQTKKEFKEAITRQVKEGRFPSTALENLGRVDDVVFRLTDGLARLNSPVLGEMNQTKILQVDSQRLQQGQLNDLRKTIFHELTHAIAGESVDIETKTFEDGYESSAVRQRKTGVSLSKEGLYYSPNRWLNEAITEWTALELSESHNGDKGSYKGSFSYMDERRELDRLFAVGLSEQEVREAYFENFTADQSKGEKGKHFKILLDRINQIEGPNGFARLENKYLLEEIQRTVQHLNIYPIEGFSNNPELSEFEQFPLTISVGTNEKTRMQRKFVYLTKPYTLAESEVTTADQLAHTKEKLQSILSLYRNKATVETDT